MATKRPRSVTTHRELTLPPEIVALVCAFKPREDHTPPYLRDRDGHYPGRGFYTNIGCFYDCCGGFGTHSTCALFAKGMYHPGTLEKWTRVTRREHAKKGGHPDQKLAPGRFNTDPILRWSCCGALVESRCWSSQTCAPRLHATRPDAAHHDYNAPEPGRCRAGRLASCRRPTPT